MDSQTAQLATLSLAVGTKLENQIGDLTKRQTGHAEKINAQASTLHSLQNAHSSAERRGGSHASTPRPAALAARCRPAGTRGRRRERADGRLRRGLGLSAFPPPQRVARRELKGAKSEIASLRDELKKARPPPRPPPPGAAHATHAPRASALRGLCDFLAAACLPQSKAETAQLQKDLLALRGLVVQELKLDARGK